MMTPESVSQSVPQSGSQSVSKAGSNPGPQPSSLSLFSIFLTVFLDLLGFGIILPIMPFYATSLGASPVTIGLLAGCFSAMQFLFAPVWGRWSDRIGRRPILLMGIVGTMLSMTAFAFATSLTQLFAARLLAGICGANIPVAQAYISDITTEENRTKGMGLFGAAFGLGFVLGPAAGGLLSQWHRSLPGLFAAALAAINFVSAYFSLKEPPKARREPRLKQPWYRAMAQFWGPHGLKHPQVGAWLALFFVVTLAFSQVEGTFALFTQRRLGFDARQVSYVFIYIGLMAAVVQGGLIGRLSKRFSEQTLITAGLALMGLGLALYFFVHGLWMLWVVVSFTSLGLGLNNPSLSSQISKKCAADERGEVMGIQQSLGSLGRMLGPVIGGFLFAHLGESAPYVLGALLLLACVLFLSASPRAE